MILSYRLIKFIQEPVRGVEGRTLGNGICWKMAGALPWANILRLRPPFVTWVCYDDEHGVRQVAIHANTYGGIYPEKIKTLQQDYSDLWGPLSDLLKQLSALVEL